MIIGCISRDEKLYHDLKLLLVGSKIDLFMMVDSVENIEMYEFILIEYGSFSKQELDQIKSTNNLYLNNNVIFLNSQELFQQNLYTTVIHNLTTYFKKNKSFVKEQLIDRITICPNVIFEIAGQKLIKNETTIFLTSQEFKILYTLLQYRGEIVKTEKLLDITEISTKKCLYVHMNSLREKLEINPGYPTLIETVFRTGYVLNNKKEAV